jgi:hypothetical protein
VLTAGCAVTRIIARSSGPFFDHGVGMEWMAENRHWAKSIPSAAVVLAAIFGKSCGAAGPARIALAAIRFRLTMEFAIRLH